MDDLRTRVTLEVHIRDIDRSKHEKHFLASLSDPSEEVVRRLFQTERVISYNRMKIDTFKESGLGSESGLVVVEEEAPASKRDPGFHAMTLDELIDDLKQFPQTYEVSSLGYKISDINPSIHTHEQLVSKFASTAKKRLRTALRSSMSEFRDLSLKGIKLQRAPDYLTAKLVYGLRSDEGETVIRQLKELSTILLDETIETDEQLAELLGLELLLPEESWISKDYAVDKVTRVYEGAGLIVRSEKLDGTTTLSIFYRSEDGSQEAYLATMRLVLSRLIGTNEQEGWYFSRHSAEVPGLDLFTKDLLLKLKKEGTREELDRNPVLKLVSADTGLSTLAVPTYLENREGELQRLSTSLKDLMRHGSPA